MCATTLPRRSLLQLATGLLLTRASWSGDAPTPELPAEVAGIALPSSPLARAAVRLARQRCPEFLFNHCMRTYLFGALLMRRQAAPTADTESAFVAAALHDLGLLPAFESAGGSFEMDGAGAAERFALSEHARVTEADRIWHAVAMHDGPFALTQRQGPEATLVALGAGADVYGLAAGELGQPHIDAVLAAFPRLQFKRQFTALLLAHCERKPASQHGTWLDGLCRAHAPAAQGASVEQHIAAAGFPE